MFRVLHLVGKLGSGIYLSIHSATGGKCHSRIALFVTCRCAQFVSSIAYKRPQANQGCGPCSLAATHTSKNNHPSQAQPAVSIWFQPFPAAHVP